MIKNSRWSTQKMHGPRDGALGKYWLLSKDLDNNENYGGTTFLFNTRAAISLCKISNYILLRHLFGRDWRWEW